MFSTSKALRVRMLFLRIGMSPDQVRGLFPSPSPKTHFVNPVQQPSRVLTSEEYAVARGYSLSLHYDLFKEDPHQTPSLNRAFLYKGKTIVACVLAERKMAKDFKKPTRQLPSVDPAILRKALDAIQGRERLQKKNQE
jgi:hypothetical protein